MRDSSSPSCSLTVAGDTLRLSLVPFPGPVGFGGCHRSENSPGYMCVYVRKRHEIGYPVCILLIRVWLSDRNSCHDGKNSTSKLPTMRVNCVNGEHVLLDVTLPSKTGVESWIELGLVVLVSTTENEKLNASSRVADNTSAFLSFPCSLVVLIRRNRKLKLSVRSSRGRDRSQSAAWLPVFKASTWQFSPSMAVLSGFTFDLACSSSSSCPFNYSQDCMYVGKTCRPRVKELNGLNSVCCRCPHL